MESTPKQTGGKRSPPAGTAQPAPPRQSTDRLFSGAREMIIEHNGEEYHLRITSKGKLILTK